MLAAKEVYKGPSRGSKGGDSGLGIGCRTTVLAGEPLLAATGETERSTLESDRTKEAEGLLVDLGGSIFFSTHTVKVIWFV